jgi:hypothetical protein
MGSILQGQMETVFQSPKTRSFQTYERLRKTKVFEHEHAVAWWEPATCYISSSSMCYHHIQSFLISWSISLSLSRTHLENWTLTHWVMPLIELRILSVLNSLALSMNWTWASITLEIVQWTAWVCFSFCVQKEHSLINEPTGIWIALVPRYKRVPTGPVVL